MEIKIELKKCGKCKIDHSVIPADSKLQFENDRYDGFYWNCTNIHEGKPCDSTLFMPLAKLKLMKLDTISLENIWLRTSAA